MAYQIHQMVAEPSSYKKKSDFYVVIFRKHMLLVFIANFTELKIYRSSLQVP